MRSAAGSPSFSPEKAPAKIAISVMPLCTVDRNLPGSDARSSAQRAPTLPVLAIAFSRASREETIASSPIANAPLTTISARRRATSSQGMGAKWSLMVVRHCGCNPRRRRFTSRRLNTGAEPSAMGAGLIADRTGELAPMTIVRSLRMLAAGCAMAALAGCQTAPPQPVVIPAAFRPLGVSAPYLLGDVIGGQKARAAKMRSAKIRPLGPYEISAYMADL